MRAHEAAGGIRQSSVADGSGSLDPLSGIAVDEDAVAGSTGRQAAADSESFADWMAGVLRREGLTMEAAARQLGVSVKTVSRWVGGATEPRLRDLRRVRELFGEIPFT
jgi:hypothetical protein